MGRRFVAAWLVLLVVFSVNIEGCTVIGYAIGSQTDKGSGSDMQPLTAPEVVTVTPGSTILFTFDDGREVEGIYQGLRSTPTPEYEQRYAAWRDTATLPFKPPALHESITFGRKSDRVRGTFLGFSPGRIHYQSKAMKNFTSERIDAIQWLTDSSGVQTAGADLRIHATRFPVQTIARVEGKQSKKHEVDLLDERIKAVSAGNYSTTGATTGMLVGLTIDMGLLITGVAFSGSSGCSPGLSAYQIGPVSMDSVFVFPNAPMAGLEP